MFIFCRLETARWNTKGQTEGNCKKQTWYLIFWKKDAKGFNANELRADYLTKHLPWKKLYKLKYKGLNGIKKWLNLNKYIELFLASKLVFNSVFFEADTHPYAYVYVLNINHTHCWALINKSAANLECCS